MAYSIDFVDNTGDYAHCNLVDRIKALAIANGWVTLRDVSSVGYREIILQGSGLTESEEIFVGFKTYENVAGDYYNILVGVFTGFVPSNTFESQPNAYLTGVPAHNNRIDYWLICNQQRIAGCLKVGTPVYESFYAGKMFQYGRPSQYPYPVICGGAFKTALPTRFSDTSHNCYVKGSASDRLGLRTNDAWINPNVSPYNSNGLCGTYQLRDTVGVYQLNPIELYYTNGLYGILDGVYHVSGFNNAVENTVSISGQNFVVFQNVWRTGFSDYFAMEMV